jgi:hypothetical protein
MSTTATRKRELQALVGVKDGVMVEVDSERWAWLRGALGTLLEVRRTRATVAYGERKITTPLVSVFRAPTCAWVDGCDARATHNKVIRNGWAARPAFEPHRADYCQRHAELEAASPHCRASGCKRAATHTVYYALADMQRGRPAKDDRCPTYCKQHADQTARTKG